VSEVEKPLRHVGKPWGYEEVLVENKDYRVKRIVIKPMHRTSLHLHRRKTETLIFPKITYSEVRFTKSKEDLYRSVASITHKVTHIPPGTRHRLCSENDLTETEIIEISHGRDGDVVRVEDDYGRAKPRTWSVKRGINLKRLRELADEKTPSYEIAKKLGVSSAVVNKWRLRLNLPKPKRGQPKEGIR